MPMSNVTFEPGCRNNWHVHNSKFPVGQVLICVEKEGWYQEFDKEVVKLSLGMVVEIPANAKHWHGAAKDSWFSHIAFSVPKATASTKWCEEVSDDECNDGVLISYFSPTKEKLESLEVPTTVETENREVFLVDGLFNDKELEKVHHSKYSWGYEWRSKSGAPVQNLVTPQHISAAPGTKTLIIEEGQNSNKAGTIDLRNITAKLVIKKGTFKEVENFYLPENCKVFIIEENAFKKVTHLFMIKKESRMI